MADFSTIRKEDCRETPIPAGCRLGGSRTVVLQSVLNEIKEHGRSSMHEEVCGVLVGALYWDDGPYLLINARIEGKHASHQSGSVTFTSETWTYIHEELAAKHADRKIVGWYHTHPGFGIFLSNMDAFIHRNFFGFPWQPAYVFDPQAETDGFFFANGDNLVQEEVAVVADAEPSAGKPMLREDGEGRLVISEDQARRKVSVAAVAASSLALLLAVVTAAIFLQLRQTKRAEKAATSKARATESMVADLTRNLEEQSEKHRRDQEEWTVKKETYEKEIDGLRVQVTTVSAERKSAESANKAEIQRLEERRNQQEADIKRLEKTLSERQEEAERTAADLESARTRARQLEARIAELEAANRNLEESARQPPVALSENKAEEPAEDSVNEAEEHPWYWHLYPSWFD